MIALRTALAALPRCAICLGLLLTAFMPPDTAVAGDVVGPHLSAQAIREARRAQSSDLLEIEAIETSRSLRKTKGNQAPAEARTTRIGLGPDYVTVSSTGTVHILDLRIKRIIRIDGQSANFVSQSMFADVAFRGFESSNRQRLSKILKKTLDENRLEEVPATMSDPFWRAAELGVAVGEDSRHEPSFRTESDGGLIVSYEGAMVARILPSATRLDPEARRLFARYLRYRHKLHPRIVDRIETSPFLPREVAFRQFKALDESETTIAFRHIGVRKAGYPLDKATASDPAFGSKDAFMRAMGPKMIAAVNGKHGGGPPSFTKMIRQAREHMDRDQVMNAFLLISEAALLDKESFTCSAMATQRIDCESVRTMYRQVGRSTEVADVFRALAPKKSKISMADAIKILRGQPRDGLVAGHILDLWLANHLSDAGLAETRTDRKRAFDAAALSAYAKAMEANPYLGCVYRDVGNHFYRRFDAVTAWHIWDLGRLLPVKPKCQLLDHVNQYEAKLQKLHPEFF